LVTKSFAYRKWTDASSRFAPAEQVHVARSLATLLEAGTSTLNAWEGSGIYFFDASHPANFADASAGTWSNYQSGALDCNSVGNILAECTAMETQVLDETGQKLAVSPDVIMLPTQKYRIVDALLKQAQVAPASGTNVPSSGATTMSNPLMGLRAVHNPHLTDANDWYLIDSKLVRTLPPWAALRYSPGLALELRVFDESSDFFKNTGKIKVSSHIWYGFGLVMPHAIRKIVGA
jgi:hypothetical protein